MSTSPLVFDPYIIQNVPGKTFLDVGCGYGKWGFLLKKYADPTQPRHVTGLDLFEPHVKALQADGIYDEVHVGDATALPFPDKSFDTVIACEVLEHLPREQGEVLIRELRRVARLCFVVSTPGFPCLRGGSDTLDGFNPHEAHQHIYSYKDFSSLGFTQIIGVGCLRMRPFKLAAAFASLGIWFPWLSRYRLGFWFADGKRRVLELE